ncbi:MAG TPA: aldose epimerase family protein [Polyangia bacterium]|nr:aldose epimerase family protein [Polyangia bacterium]
MKQLVRVVSGVILAVGVWQAGVAAKDSFVPLKVENFEKEIDGKKVTLYTIKNDKGMVVRITNYGAKMQQILVPDKNGVIGDVLLGYDTIGGVLEGQQSMGAFIGRYANRIGAGKLKIDGVDYQLAINNGPNSLHGGKKGSRFVVFDARQLDPASVEMTYVFKDGEENYPGNVPLRVIYSVTPKNELVIAYDATTDKKTVVNFTSHGFYNLAGQEKGDILGHVVWINAESFTPIDKNLIPTGEIRPVKGTPMDFLSKPMTVGARIAADDEQLKMGPGYDHNFVLNKKGSELALAARVYEPTSGRVMEVYTTEPGLQFYSGNFLEGKQPRDVGKGGRVYGFRTGFCMEADHFPDSPNKPNFPNTVLDKGQWYSGKTIYKFSVRK